MSLIYRGNKFIQLLLCLLLVKTCSTFSSRLRVVTRKKAPSVPGPTCNILRRFSSKSNDSLEDESNGDDDMIHDELVSPEMLMGMTTLSEEATASTDIALFRFSIDEDQSEIEPSAVEVETVITGRTEDVIEAPSVKKIIKFAIPAIGVWLCSPLLSLIDTSAVGLLSGTAQQAALNPAVAVTEYAALLIAFMYTATTNLVASAQAADLGSDGMPLTTKTFVSALQLSGFVGAALGSILFAFAVPILRTIIGNNSIDPNVFFAALKYVRIRALGMPAAAIIGSSQAACLGIQDIKSPLYVLVAAAVVNFFGDLAFVGSSHPWIGGAAGAAWATVFSQYAAVFFFVLWICHGPDQRDTSRFAFLRRSKELSTRGFLKGKFRAFQFFRLPSKDMFSGFIPYVLPVTSTQIGRVSSYVAMSHVISSSLGTVNMAAQQVIISIWNCLYPAGESLSLTAQSFVPSIFAQKVGKARTDALRCTLLNFWKAGLLFGTGLATAVMAIPIMHGFFTADAAVMASVNSVVPLLLVIFSTLGLFTSSEGVMLAQKDLGFLGKSYSSFFFIMPYLMLRLKRKALSGVSIVTLQSVWTLFTAYQLFRTVAWMLRALQLQRRTNGTAQTKEADAI